MNLRYKTISFFCLYEFRGNIFQFSSLFWLLVMSSILISLSFSHKRWRYKSYYVWNYHLVTCTEERRSVSPYRFPLLRTGSRSSRPPTPKISRPTTPNPSRPTTPNPSNARQRVSNINQWLFSQHITYKFCNFLNCISIYVSTSTLRSRANHLQCDYLQKETMAKT